MSDASKRSFSWRGFICFTLEKLEQAGIQATRGMTLRDLADAANLHSSEIRRLLE